MLVKKSARPEVMYYDVETYPNYLLFVFKNVHGQYFIYDDEDIKYRKDKIRDEIFPKGKKYLFVGFNNVKFDSIFLDYLHETVSGRTTRTFGDNLKYENWTRECPEPLRSGFTSEVAYTFTQALIERNVPHYELRKNISIDKYTLQLDLMTHSIAGQISLKELGIRTGFNKLESLPYRPSTILTDEQKEVVKYYCINDVDVTEHIANTISKDTVEGKLIMIERMFDYDWSLLSKTNASITGEYLNPDSTRYTKSERFYEIPERLKNWLKFDSPVLNEVLNKMCSLNIGETLPKGSLEISVEAYGITLEFGLGGLHGCKPGTFENLIDADFASYYPFEMKMFDFFPEFVATNQKEFFFHMIDDRIANKHRDPGLAYAQKICINSVYGCLNYAHSPIYSPYVAYSVCFTGQLIVARLIELMYHAGYETTTTNTDGWTFLDNGDDVSWKAVIDEAIEVIGIDIETTKLKQTTMRDVNNYIWITESGKTKVKGAYAVDASKKSASHLKVVVDSLVNHVVTGEPVDSYIRNRYEQRIDAQEWLLYHKYGTKSYTTTVVRPTKNGEYVNINKELSGDFVFGGVIRYQLSNVAQNQIIAFGDTVEYVTWEEPKQLKTKIKWEERSCRIEEFSRNPKMQNIEKVEKWTSKCSEYTDNVRPVFDINSEFSWEEVDLERYIKIAEEKLLELPLESTSKRREFVSTIAQEIPDKTRMAISDMLPSNLLSELENKSSNPIYLTRQNLLTIEVEAFTENYYRFAGDNPLRVYFEDVDGSLKCTFLYPIKGKLKSFKERKNDAIKVNVNSESSKGKIGYYDKIHTMRIRGNTRFGNDLRPLIAELIAIKDSQLMFE